MILTKGEIKKYRKDSTSFVRNQQRESETVGLKDTDDRKPVRRIRHDASKIFLTNLIYMVSLTDTLRMIIPFYWNAGKTIIDVTAGKRLIWKKLLYNCQSSCGFSHWNVEFNDINPEIPADYHVPAKELHLLNKHWDIGVVDFPFVELKDGVESFGVRAKRQCGRSAGDIERAMKRSRKFYFNNYEPLKKVFPECVEAFNKSFDSMIVKMGNSHKNKRAIMNCTEVELALDHERNPESEFHLVDSIGYRGNYARRGGRFPFAQSVLSYYMIFKKDVNKR